MAVKAINIAFATLNVTAYVESVSNVLQEVDESRNINVSCLRIFSRVSVKFILKFSLNFFTTVILELKLR